jgi:hypothetical protein
MPRIDEYSFGHIVIDGHTHKRDVIILPSRVVSEWWRAEGHSLVIEDLDDVADELPRHLVVGAGAHGQLKPDPGALEELEARGVEVEVLDTPQAVRRYGELDESTTAAALHLTC